MPNDVARSRPFNGSQVADVAGHHLYVIGHRLQTPWTALGYHREPDLMTMLQVRNQRNTGETATSRDEMSFHDSLFPAKALAW